MAASKNLTARQSVFAREYLHDLNAAAAYRRAGYTARGNSAEVNAARLLRNAQVAEAIESAMAERAREPKSAPIACCVSLQKSPSSMLGRR